MFRVPPPHHHQSSGQARVKIQGRHYYLGRWGSPEADRKYQQLVGNLAAAGVAAPRPDATVTEIAAAYLTHCHEYYRHADGTPTQQIDRITSALKFVTQLHADTAANAFGPLALMAVRQRMIEHGWCRRLINQSVGCIKRCFKWAASRELVNGETWHRLNTVEGLKRGRTTAAEAEPVTPVPEEVVRQALPFMAPPVAAIVQVQLLAGMRPGEAVRMGAAEIDRQGPEGCWVYRPKHHKTAWRGVRKEILLGPRAQAVLAPFLLKYPEGPLFRPAEAMAWHSERRRAGRQTKVQPSQRNRRKGRKQRPLRERYDRDSYRRAITYACKQAGIPAWSPHRLRHSRATQIRLAFSLDEARAVLGHATADITEVYAARDANMAARVMRQIG